MPIPIDYTVDVSVELLPQAYGNNKINTIAVFTDDKPLIAFGINELFRRYGSYGEVANDFATDSITVQLAKVAFAQTPNFMTAGGSLVIIPCDSSDNIVDKLLETREKIGYYPFVVERILTKEEIIDLSDAVQALKSHIFYYGIGNSDIDSIATEITLKKNINTRLIYHSNKIRNAPLVAMAIASSMHSLDYETGNAKTMNLKSLNDVSPDDTIDTILLRKLNTAGVDCYAIGEDGTGSVYCSGSNEFLDNVYNLAILKLKLQEASYNTLKTTNTKIPQDEKGMDSIKDPIRNVLTRAVANGIISTGLNWNSNDILGLDRNKFVKGISANGFFIYSNPIATQTQVSREKREAPSIQIAIKLGGAIHFIHVPIKAER